MDPSEEFKPSPSTPSTARPRNHIVFAPPQPSRSSSLLPSRASISGLPPPPHPLSTSPTLNRYHQSPIFDQTPTYSKPDIRPPFGSNRSSSSTAPGGEGQVVVPFDAEEVDLPFDYFFEGDGGGDSGSSPGSVGGFSELHVQEGPLLASSYNPHLSLPSSSYPSSSHLPLPSPLIYLYATNLDATRRHDEGWHSLNPFAAEAQDGEDGSSLSVAGFTLIKSMEETRTPQACQACRSRKSKCDGNAPCIRCENRGIACVYVARSPRTRGATSKRSSGPVREPTASSRLASCFTTQPLAHPSILSPRAGDRGSEQGVPRSRRRSSDGEFGVVAGPQVLRKRDKKSRSSPVGGEGTLRVRSPLAEVAGDGSEEFRRRRPSSDLYTSPRVPDFIGSLQQQQQQQQPPPFLSHSQSYPRSIDYPSFHAYDQSYYPPPPLHPSQQIHRHSIAETPPHLAQQHPYPRALSEHQIHSHSGRYSPFAMPASLHQYGSAPSHPSLLLEQRSDASTSFNVEMSAHHPLIYPHHAPGPSQSQINHSESRRSSLPSVQAPSTGSHLGFFPRVVEEVEGSPVGGRDPGAGASESSGVWAELRY